MGKVIQYTRSGRVSRVLGSPVRIFYSLLFICTLEVSVTRLVFLSDKPDFGER